MVGTDKPSPENSLGDDEFIHAEKYDRMINWETRLAREIPFMVKRLIGGNILDVACSTGRHSFELEKHGFSCFGIDKSEGMINLAKKHKDELGSSASFLAVDATDPELETRLEGFPNAFDGAILLGNAIANMGPNGRQMLQNVHSLLKPDGRFIIQTVNRPEEPHYLPIRKVDGQTLVQRIMVPVNADESRNAELHVNIIDCGSLEYVQQNKAPLFMYTFDELQSLLIDTGFKIEETYSGYGLEPVSPEGGRSVLWVLRK